MSDEAIRRILKSLHQGVATTVLAAVGKDWEGRGGRCLEDCEEAKRGVDDHNLWGAGYVSHIYDLINEARLWRDSLDIAQLEDEMRPITNRKQNLRPFLDST